MQLVYVFEGQPADKPEYILTLGASGFKSVEALKKTIAGLPEGSTVEWAPGCERLGGEPLTSKSELDDLKAFCDKEKIKFVHIPSG